MTTSVLQGLPAPEAWKELLVARGPQLATWVLGIALCVQAAERGGGIVHPPLYGGMGGLDRPATVVMEAEDAGLTVIMDRCPKIEHGRFSGELGWMGINRKVIDNRKPLLFGKGGSLKRI